MAQNAPPAVVIPMAGLIEQPGNDVVLIPVNHPLAVQFASDGHLHADSESFGPEF